MRWRFRESPAQTLEAHRAELEPTPPEHVLHRSPGLWTLLDVLNESRTHRILDLGAAVGSNVAYFSRFSCRLRIADLLRSLSSDPRLSERSREDPEAVFSELLPLDSVLYDVVFAWDTFDYLDRAQLRALAAHLARLCSPGGRLLALVSAGREIPEKPGAFRIADPGLVLYEVPTHRVRPASGHTPAEVEQALGGFAADRVFLLRHGVRESLFIRKG